MRLAEGWEVEWCANIPKNECGENDIERADIRIQDFATRAAAIKFAQKMLPKDCFGCVSVNQFRLEPIEPGYPGLTKEYTGQTETVD